MKPISKDEDRLWEEHLYHEEPDADFTLKLMQKLDGVSMESGEDEHPFVKKIHENALDAPDWNGSSGCCDLCRRGLVCF
ncbi:hypothetical protein [Paenibacillus sp. W2I17]|uniref:hypothetical protein n=1 Tax=Paenibacillus sp. W2I17 TaxID=3042311 RepID=UPI002789F47D|nr:hypothetical protein [Paenibacillus sp. W2I17]MDQ0658247.1 hypothetical protein [Paenibacillus sp. W2I17]